MNETYCHLMKHKMHIKFNWRTFKFDVKCPCEEHYLHLRFSFRRFPEALHLWRTW